MEKAIGRSILEEYDGLTESKNLFTTHFNAIQQKVKQIMIKIFND